VCKQQGKQDFSKKKKQGKQGNLKGIKIAYQQHL